MVHVTTIPVAFPARVKSPLQKSNRIVSNPVKRASPLRFRRNSRHRVALSQLSSFFVHGNNSFLVISFVNIQFSRTRRTFFIFCPDASSLRAFIKEVVKEDVSRASICSWLACLFARVSFSHKIKGRKKEGRKEDFGLISRG